MCKMYKNLRKTPVFRGFEEVGRRLLETFWLHFGRLKASWILVVVCLYLEAGNGRLEGGRGDPRILIRDPFHGEKTVLGAWGEDIQEGGKLLADLSQPVAPLRKLEGAGGYNSF